MLFANLAEAVAEGRGKAQAETLRKTRTETTARRLRDDGTEEQVARHRAAARRPRRRRGRPGHPGRRRRRRGGRDGRRVGDHRRVRARHPRVRRRPVRRHRGHDRAVRPDRRQGHEQARRDLHRPDDRARRGRVAAEDPERDRADHPAHHADPDLPVRRRARSSRWRSTRARGSSLVVLVALLVCLIPTTIGALLSAIGIAGMDRLVQHNVLAMSGRAVEAAGDVSTLLLDKTGTITFGNRQASDVVPVDGRRPRASCCGPRTSPRSPTRRPRAARSSTTPWRTASTPPRGRSPSCGRRAPSSSRSRPRPGCPASTCPTAPSVRKGAGSAVAAWVESSGGHVAARPALRRRRDQRERRHPARRGDLGARGERRAPWASSTSRTSSSPACASASTSCGRWASAP